MYLSTWLLFYLFFGLTNNQEAFAQTSNASSSSNLIKYSKDGYPYLGCVVRNAKGGVKEDTLCNCRSDKTRPCATSTQKLDKERYLGYTKYLDKKAPYSPKVYDLMEKVVNSYRDISNYYFKGEKLFPHTKKKQAEFVKLKDELKKHVDNPLIDYLKEDPVLQEKRAEFRSKYLAKAANVLNNKVAQENPRLKAALEKIIASPGQSTAIKSLANSPNIIPPLGQVPVLVNSSDPSIVEPPAPDHPLPFNLLGLNPIQAQLVLDTVKKDRSLVVGEEDDIFARISKTYQRRGIPQLIDEEQMHAKSVPTPMPPTSTRKLKSPAKGANKAK